MQSRPHLSLVLNATAGDAQYLDAALASIAAAADHAAAEHGIRSELILVLDRSDREVDAWAEAASFGSFAGVTVLKVDHGSLALSRNAGIAEARGTYIATCDSDDLVSHTMYSALYAALSGRRAPAAAFPEYIVGFGDQSFLGRYYPGTDVPPPAFFDYHPFISRVMIDAAYAKANPYRATGAGAGTAYEDWCFDGDLVADRVPIVIGRSATLYYRQRPASLMREAAAETQVRIIPPNRLFQPARFAELARPWLSRLATQTWVPPSPAAIAEAFFRDDTAQQSAIRAQAIEPAITLEPDRLGTPFSNLHGVAGSCRGAPAPMGLAYANACAVIGRGAYQDVLVLCEDNDGARQMLDAVARAQRDGVWRRLLVLLGAGSASFAGRLPSFSYLIDLASLTDDEACMDLIAIRLIQQANGPQHLHIAPGALADRLRRKFGRVIGGIAQTNYLGSPAMAASASR